MPWVYWHFPRVAASTTSTTLLYPMVTTTATTTISGYPFDGAVRYTAGTVQIWSGGARNWVTIMGEGAIPNNASLDRGRFQPAAPAIVRPEVERAQQLLLAFLDPEQQAEFRRRRSFVVVAKSGRRYRIRWGSAGNVERIERTLQEDQVLESLCFHPSDYGLPIPDVMLAQLLALRHDEEEARRVANITRLGPARYAPLSL